MTTLTSPHDLLAAIPFLIGYHPSDSLVLVAIKEGAVSMAMRVDYPNNENTDAYDLLAHHLKLDGADAALMIAYVPSDKPELYETGAEVLGYMAISLLKNSIEIRESIEVIGKRWRSVICEDISCCPPEGNPLPDFDSSRVAAEQVMAGRTMPFIDVSKLADSIAALPNIGIDFVAEVESWFVHEDAPDLNEKQRDGATAVVDLGLLYEAGRGSSDPDLVAQVIGGYLIFKFVITHLEFIVLKLLRHIGQCGKSYCALHLLGMSHRLPQFLQPWHMNQVKER
jgi:hypothetical protein